MAVPQERCAVDPPPGRLSALSIKASLIIDDVGPTGNLIPDAHLAALAREHGLTVVSTDSDFAKFRDVAWLNPVTGEERRSSA